jgi:excinuclease UvrABC helicase subunit UvrB
MLFGNFSNFNRIFRELESFDELFNDLTPRRGKENVQSGSDDNGEWEKRSYVSDNGLFSYTYFTRKGNSTNKNKNEINNLKLELDECVEKQDFEKAVELRDKIKKLEENKEELKELNKELEDCVKTQDFERAIVVRDKIKKLK